MDPQQNFFLNSQRRWLRLPVQELAVATLNHDFEAVIVNLSSRGLGLHSTKKWHVTSVVYLSFFLPGSFNLVEGSAKVVWSDSTGRLGVEFSDNGIETTVSEWMLLHHPRN